MPDDQASKPPTQLVMTPQLRMALRVLSMTQDELFTMVAKWRDEHPDALADLAPGDPEPISKEEQDLAAEQGIPPWSFPTGDPPLPDARPRPDVWVFGDPPRARANPAATPRVKPVFDDSSISQSAAGAREATWLARAVRQRAKTQEQIVAALLGVCPQMATALVPDKLERLSVQAVATALAMHESTIEKVASACRYQTIHGVVQLVAVNKAIAHRALW